MTSFTLISYSGLACVWAALLLAGVWTWPRL